ncbi:hydroxyacylglutathione hydrolase [Gammaproteobacteria bacterium]|nr:hydroxyacylglutathione hydrolase [Gammaproteobacteria bacterium]
MITSIRLLGAGLNYCHILHDEHFAIIVDPGEAGPVLDWLETHRLHLTHILITHHHADHIGGVNAIIDHFPNALVVASSKSTVAHDINLKHLATLTIDWLSEQITCLHIPGHTMDHCAFLYQHAAFVGDTLFSLGCGRNFEGSFETMLNSLNLMKTLRDDTMLYFAHEYTLNNLAFTLSLIDSPSLQSYQQSIPLKTVPSSLGFEKKHNLFLQCHQPSLWNRLRNKLGPIQSEIECFTKLRIAKNSF